MIRGISYKFRYNKSRHNTSRYNKFKSNKYKKTKARILIIVIGVIVIAGIIMLFPHFIRNTYKVTVTNKLIVNHDNTEVYLIYTQTEDGEIRIFENTNNLLEMKYNSEDLYVAMGINKKYEVRAYGFNIPLFSDYENIVKVKGIPK